MRAILAVVMAAVFLSACAVEEKSRQDFERHQMSMLEISRSNPSMLIFETQVDARYPEDSEEAEAVRMRWLQGWLDRGGFCPAGYEILSRRRIGPGEINFHHMDLRYELRCLEAAPAG